MKVLIVEDDADVRELVRWALRAEGGFSVEECGAAEEALAAVERVRPDVLLLDVMMPGVDGVTLARSLRGQEESADVKIVFLTACLRPDDIARYAAVGALDVIAKPFDANALGARLRAAVEGAAADPAASDSLESLGRGYRSELPDRIRDIERALADAAVMDEAVARQAALLAHRLARAAAIFGLSAVSEAARALEDALGRSLIEDAEASRRSIEGLVGRLRRHADETAQA